MMKTGMLAKVFRWVFMGKSVRESLKSQQKAEPVSATADEAPEPSQREHLKDSALALLRERRGEFEALDKSVQDKVAKAAAKALSNHGKPARKRN
ncbi:MAG: hypothetical protein JKY20_00255 [Alphaproteobacteria bacterium]|nr:hypothetical protein [Alphaproteobacteria bacterium]